nr:ATP-dependent zinc metalloprotease FTSH 12, chloroplastic [Tanacetum cinerariifolium]
TEELAMKGLMANRHILDLISNELLEKSRITGLEVKERVEKLSPEMFEDFVKPFQINVEEIAREMVISPRNSRLGFATLTNRVGLANRADSTDGELIKYRSIHADYAQIP